MGTSLGHDKTCLTENLVPHSQLMGMREGCQPAWGSFLLGQCHWMLKGIGECWFEEAGDIWLLWTPLFVYFPFGWTYWISHTSGEWVGDWSEIRVFSSVMNQRRGGWFMRLYVFRGLVILSEAENSSGERFARLCSPIPHSLTGKALSASLGGDLHAGMFPGELRRKSSFCPIIILDP